MNHTLFLKFALLGIAVPALVVLLLPDGVRATYVDVVEPLSLFIGFVLALFVSFNYSKQIRAAFTFLAVFLFIYMLAIILFLSSSPLLLPHLESRLSEADILSLVYVIQFVNYSMIFLFCVNLLKAIKITELDRNGWLLFVLTCIFCLLLAIYPRLDLIKPILSFELLAILPMAIRVFDAGLIIILMPMLWLYIQYLKSQQRQSLTFTVVIFGILCSTLFDYLFELVLTIFPYLLTAESPLRAIIPEILFIYGYLMIAVGLYAHRRQDAWGYNAIDRAMKSG